MKTAAAIKFSSQPVTRSIAHTKTNGTDTLKRPLHLYKNTCYLSRCSILGNSSFGFNLNGLKAQ